MKTSTTLPLTRISRLTGSPRLPLCGLLILVTLFALGLSLPASILDDFSGAKAGWTDTPNGGSIAQSGGLFTITTTAANGGNLSTAAKTATNFANAAGATFEFRVDVNTVTPGTGDTNALAILASGSYRRGSPQQWL